MASTNRCIFIDFETRSPCPIDKGTFRYASDPNTEILLLSYSVEDFDPVCIDFTQPGWQEGVKRFNHYILNNYQVIAHNFLFEIAILKYKAKKYGITKPRLEQFRCTMQMCGRAGVPLALEYAGPALGLPEDKLAFGRLLILKFCVPKADGSFNELRDSPREAGQFRDYCDRDTVQSRDIWRNLPEWNETELRDVMFDLKSNLHGVPIDTEAARIIYKNVMIEQKTFATRAEILTKGIITKMTQHQRLKQWVQRYVNDEIGSCDADHVSDILAGIYGPVDDITTELLEMRQHSGKSSTSKFLRYIDASIDDYVYGMLISFGAHTGRAISKQLNLYNLPKPSVEYESMDILVDNLKVKSIEQINATYGSYLKAASTAIRGIVSAPPGKRIFVSDYAAIEARIVFWLAGSRAGVDKFARDEDIYKDMAAFIYSKQYNSVTDSERWVGKQAVLGCGYGLGAKGFVNSCLRYGVEVPFDEASNAVQTYRETYADVVDLWDDIEEQSLRACRSGKVTYAARNKIAFKTFKTKSGMIYLAMRLPSGRCIYYPHVKTAMVKTPWGEHKLAITYKKAKDRGFFRDSTYGGKLTENAVQAIARDIMYYGAQCASDEGFKVLFTVYDEVIGLNKDTASLELYNEALCRSEDWAEGIPLKAEGEIMRRYRKLS